MDIEARLAAIEEAQIKILHLLVKKESMTEGTMTLKEAAEYVGYSPDHFRRLAVEQRIIAFSRPSGHQKGKLLFRKAALDKFLSDSNNEEKEKTQPGRKRRSKGLRFW